MNDKEWLRDELTRRIRRVLDAGDRRAVLEPAAERAAADLLTQAGHTVQGIAAIDIEDGYVLAYYHLARHMVLPPALAAEELERAKFFFRGLVAVAPQLVPESLHDQLFESPLQQARTEAMTLAKQAMDCRDRARASHDVQELDRAIALLKKLLALGLPNRYVTGFHASLSEALYERYGWARDPDDLDSAIAAARLALATDESPAGADDRWAWLDSLVKQRYGLTDAPEHLDELVELRRAWLPAAQLGTRGSVHLKLAATLLERHAKRTDPADLREAVQHAHPEATDLGNEDAAMLVTRFTLLRSCYFFDNSLVDESDLITVGQAALDRGPADNDATSALRANVAYFHLRRYDSTGHSGDLVDAESLAQGAVEAMSDDDERRVPAQGTLAKALIRRHELTVRTSAINGFEPAHDNDVDEALRLLKRRINQTPPGHPLRKSVLDDLGDAYVKSANTDDRPDLLDDAIDAFEQALDASEGSEERCDALRQLALALQQRYMAYRREADLDRAVELCREAIAIAPTGTYYERMARLGLAEKLATRLIRYPGRDDDRQAAMEVYREVALGEHGGIIGRTSAARSWGRIMQEAGRYEEALAGYDVMLSLMSDLAPLGLGEVDRVRRVDEWEGWPDLAVGCALAAGRPEVAIEMLERARMVTAPAVRVGAADVAALRRQYPQLAADLEAANADLGLHPHGQDVAFAAGVTLVREGRHDVRRRAEVAAQTWHDSVMHVRKLPGFDRFLMPARFDELRRAADGGPVAVLTANADRCDAVLMTPDRFELVPLPVTYNEVKRWGNRYIEILQQMNGATASLERRTAVEDELARILAWLWDSTVQPILDALGFRAPTSEVKAPHLWWSPSGIYSLFPLHAAESTPDDGAMDRVMSSYAPSLRLLAHLNNETDVPSRDPLRLLAVGLADTPGLKNAQLPDVQLELEAVARAFPSEYRTVLANERATVSTVKAALPRHDSLHLACHARQYPADPSSSQLYLHDGTFSVRDLRWADLHHSRLAVLSACQTAMTGNTLMNEGLHLGAALHIAGCRDVVGTLWTIGDSSAAQLAERLYAHLRRGGELDTGIAATALHLAVRELRAEAPDLYSSWAPFVHLGAAR